MWFHNTKHFYCLQRCKVMKCRKMECSVLYVDVLLTFNHLFLPVFQQAGSSGSLWCPSAAGVLLAKASGVRILPVPQNYWSKSDSLKCLYGNCMWSCLIPSSGCCDFVNSCFFLLLGIYLPRSMDQCRSLVCSDLFAKCSVKHFLSLGRWLAQAVGCSLENLNCSMPCTVKVCLCRGKSWVPFWHLVCLAADPGGHHHVSPAWCRILLCGSR